MYIDKMECDWTITLWYVCNILVALFGDKVTTKMWSYETKKKYCYRIFVKAELLDRGLELYVIMYGQSVYI